MSKLSYPILSMFSTTSEKVKDLPIKNGQMILVKDKCKIAMDIDDTRKFYNEITILKTDNDRTSLNAPINGAFYFVSQTSVLWHFDSKWIQVTVPSEDIVYWGDELPNSGKDEVLYINKKDKSISYWDSSSNDYITIAERFVPITDEDINQLFI